MSSATKVLTSAPAEVYRQRRVRLAAQLHRPLVLFSGHAPARNYPNNTHRFRPASSYLYFGGPPLEHAALVIEPGSDGDHGCLLARPVLTPDDRVWFGDLPDDAELAAAAGLDPARLCGPEQLEWALAGHEVAAVIPPFPQTIAWANQLGLPAASGGELRAIIALRLIKDEHELTAMRRAASVTVEAHRAALAACRPGGREADVAAAFTRVLVAHQCDHSFSPIITVHGEILHSAGHPHTLRDGALLLIDAAAEEPTAYAGDMTRTAPVNGRWTAVQRHFYDTVERALNEAVAACRPGVRYRDVHFLAARIICEGLVQAEVLRGEPEELATRAAHGLFFTHGIGHLIGMDVHDMEDFGDLAGYAPGRTRPTEFGNKFLRLDRDLEAGYCLTIEPGIYLVPALWATPEIVQPYRDVVNREKVDALLRDQFGGIRIEHTIHVRADGPPEVLTAALPTQADAVAGLVGRE